MYQNKMEDIKMTNEARLEELKKELIDVLTKMDQIKPVQFCDIDCDNQVFNFSGVSIDENDNRVYVNIAMWHDNLPSHEQHPLTDGRGREILPLKSDGRYSEIITNVNLSTYNNYNGDTKNILISDGITRGGLISMLKTGKVMFDEVQDGCELLIKYDYDGKECFASICNKTSDVSDEWFEFGCGDEIVERSILDGKDYSMDYNDARLRAEDKGVKLTQHDYLEQLQKTSTVSDLLKQAEG